MTFIEALAQLRSLFHGSAFHISYNYWSRESGAQMVEAGRWRLYLPDGVFQAESPDLDRLVSEAKVLQHSDEYQALLSRRANEMVKTRNKDFAQAKAASDALAETPPEVFDANR